MEQLSKIGFHAAYRKYKDIDMFHELVAYQDTGLTPEEIINLAELAGKQLCGGVKAMAEIIDLKAENERWKARAERAIEILKNGDWWDCITDETPSKAELELRIALDVATKALQVQLDREKEPDNTAIVRCVYDESNDTIIFKCTCGQVVERKDEYWNYCPKCGKRLMGEPPKEENHE